MTVALAVAPAVRFLADSDADKASPIGLFVVFALLVASFFLFRSMSKHLRKVPTSFDKKTDATEPDAGTEPPGVAQAGDRPEITDAGAPTEPGASTR